MSSIESLVSSLKDDKIRKETILLLQRQMNQKLEKEVKDLTSSIEVLSKTKEAFKYLVDRMVVEGVRKVETLLTYGLRTVFDDQDISARVQISEKRGLMNMEIFIKDGNIEAPIIGSFGGGPVIVVSFLLRVLALINLKLRKFLIFDESFNHLSPNYVPKMGQLISILCAKTGINMLLVTQQEGFIEVANVAYKAEKKADALVLQKLH